MKAFRSTSVMFVLVGALAGYTYWDYRKTQKNQGVDVEQEKRLFSVESNEVSEILVRQKDAVVHAVKKNGEWSLLKPVEDEADGSAVEAFIYSAVIQKGKFFRNEDESKTTNWAEYGLDPVMSSIEVTAAKGKESVDVSSKNAFDGSYFVRKGGELLLGDRGLAQIVGRDASNMRQRRLWRDTESEISAAVVEVNYGATKAKYSIVLKGGKWEIEPKPPFLMDLEKTANWLVSLEKLTAQKVIYDLPEPAKEQKELVMRVPDLGLPLKFVRSQGAAAGAWIFQQPSVRVKLKFKKPGGAEGEWTMTASPDFAEDAYVMSSTRATVYKIPAQNLAVFRAPVEYFRDGKKPFEFPVEQARQIETWVDGKHLKFIKDGSDWKPEGGGESPGDKLVAMIQNVRGLEALEFYPPGQAAGFKPEQKLVVRDEKGGILLDLSWGNTFPPASSHNKGMTFRYARTNLEKDAMGVSAGAIDSLTHALAAKKSDGKQTGKK